MNIASIINAQKEEDSDLALDFSSFLLRYHRDLDYADFADDPLIGQKIKRAETYRAWADIEDLANGFESLQTNIEQHQTTAANAFQELYNYMEKTKKEINLKTDDTKAEVLYVRDEVRKMQGLYNPEKDQALKDFGDLRSQLGDFLANKIRILENQVEDKVVSLDTIILLETHRGSGEKPRGWRKGSTDQRYTGFRSSHPIVSYYEGRYDLEGSVSCGAKEA
jgi:hypothetical protein